MTASPRSQLRQLAIQNRASLTAEKRTYYSKLIAACLSQEEKFRQAKMIMAFYPIRQEVDIFPLLYQQFPEKTWLLPRVQDHLHMCAVIFSPESQTILSPFGIPEPAGDPVAPGAIDLVIVPGVAFDLKGYRLGYGRGYYDRFLPLLRANCTTCGVCFDVQVLGSIYPESHDVPVQMVITERQHLLFH